MVPADIDQDGLLDVVTAAKERDILIFRRTHSQPARWQTRTVAMPPEAGSAKAVHVGDLDLDGQSDIVFTCEGAAGGPGVVWLTREQGKLLAEATWTAHDIGGPEGVKFDLIQLIDLDTDGDLDVLTCEERDNLGAIWYENPAR